MKDIDAYYIQLVFFLINEVLIVRCNDPHLIPILYNPLRLTQNENKFLYYNSN